MTILLLSRAVGLAWCSGILFCSFSLSHDGGMRRGAAFVIDAADAPNTAKSCLYSQPKHHCCSNMSLTQTTNLDDGLTIDGYGIHYRNDDDRQ
jgi:hypothetical protein